VTADPGRDTRLSQVRARLAALGLSDFDAWVNYMRCAGSGGVLEFEAYLHGALVMAPADLTALMHSLWEAENL
jgi:hypothetical protein